MAYVKTTWTNDSGQAIDEDNLNKIEDGIYDAHTDIATNTAAIANGLKYTSPGTGAVAINYSDLYDVTVRVEDFGITGDGTTDDTTKVQAAIDHCETLLSATHDDTPVVTLRCDSPIGISAQLTFDAKLRFNVDFACTVNVLATWSGATSDPAIVFNQDMSDIRVNVLNCNRKCAGVQVTGYNVNFHKSRIFRFLTYGIYHSAGGNTHFSDVVVRQVDQDDSEWGTDASWNAKGVWIDKEDGVWVSCTITSCDIPVYLDTDSGSTFMVGCHFWNGRNEEGGTYTKRSDPSLVEAHNTGEVHLVNCYFDCGHVDIRAENLFIHGGRYLQDTTNQVTITTPDIRYYNDTGVSYARNANIFNIDASVGFYDGTGGAFTGTYTDINAMSLLSNGNTTEVFQQRNTIIPTDLSTDAEAYWKPGGTYEISYHIQGEDTNKIIVGDDESNGQSEFAIRTDGFRVKSVSGSVPHQFYLGAGETGFREESGGVLSVYSGAVNSWIFEGGATPDLVPGTDDTYDIGSSSATVAQGYINIIIQNPVTVASLPAAGTIGEGARAFVTDATATTFASVVAGSGANNVPVYSDGTDWRIG